MREVLAFVVGIIFAVMAFGLVAVATCFITFGVIGPGPGLALGAMLGVAAAVGAGYSGIRLVLGRRD